MKVFDERAFDDQLREWMKEWKIPGAAVSAVFYGEPVIAKGYGLLDINKHESVTGKSMFLLNSVTKSMTGFAIALLVEQGLCSWDVPVKHYIPELQMYDPITTEHMTLRDMLSHRSGQPYYTLFWHPSPFTRKEMMERLRYLPPSKDFRSVFQYNNLMYTLAGYVIERITGTSWEAFMKQHVLEPLAMNESSTNFEDVITRTNLALPHNERDGKMNRIELVKLQAVAPAGGVYTNVLDMVKYMELVIEGKSSLLSSPTMNEWLNPVIAIPYSRLYREMGGDSYAMGWRISHYKGRHMVYHGGGGLGYSSLCLILPDEHIGITVLINTQQMKFPQIPAYYLADLLLGTEVTPWNDRMKKANENASLQKLATEDNKTLPGIMNAKSKYSNEQLCGDYEHAGLGIISIHQGDEGMYAMYNLLRYNLIPFEKERFTADGLLKSVHFHDRNNQMMISVPFEPALDEFTFVKTRQ